jgi:hypothetical protein
MSVADEVLGKHAAKAANRTYDDDVLWHLRNFQPKLLGRTKP